MVLTDRFRDDLRQVQDAGLSSVRTIHGLLLRESRTRYGRRSAGYVWALISPMILLVVMMVVFSAIARPAGAGESRGAACGRQAIRRGRYSGRT